MNEPHAPDAILNLPDDALCIDIERTICLIASEQMGEQAWSKELLAASDPRSTIARFALLVDDPQRLALVVMLQGLRRHPQAWSCGAAGALDVFPEARPAVLDIARRTPGSGDWPWKP
jgi:hypothetical protein